MRALAILALIALGAGTAAAGAPAADPPVARALRRAQLLARALDALTRRYPLDYHLPMQPAPPGDEARDRFLDVCADGDAHACWVAATLDRWRDGPARARVVEHCRAGDLLSCRALPSRIPALRDLPGRAGRSVGCRSHGLEERDGPCDLAALQRECRDGFANSCALLDQAPETPERPQQLARAKTLARQGCEADLLTECDLVLSDDSPANRALVIAHSCPLDLASCGVLVREYHRRHDRLRARDVEERMCQYGRDDDEHQLGQRSRCGELAGLYAQGDYPEPVPGRGEALRVWECEDETLQRTATECGPTRQFRRLQLAE